MYIKHWVNERLEQMRQPVVPIQKSEPEIVPYQDMSAFFQAIEDNYGSECRIRIAKSLVSQCSDLAKSYVADVIGTGDAESILNYIYAYSIRSVDSEDLKKSVASRWQFSVAEKEIKRSFLEVLWQIGKLTDGELGKAVDDKEWKRIAGNTLKNGANSVDHTYHTDVGKIPKGYEELINNSTKKYPSVHVEGLAPKMVHEIGKNTFMTKPYHKRAEHGTKENNPHSIMGWAAMATKALFHAGGIGHLCEKVHAAEVNGVPVTIHQFEPNSSVAGEVAGGDSPPTINPLHLQQIACMDFLSNNRDRHYGNLVISKNRSREDGCHKVTAIDHERNFQYANDFGTDGDHVGDYVDAGPLNPNEYEEGPYKHSMLTDWWKKNKDKISNEFEKQLVAVKSDKLREHIRRNFESRVDYLGEQLAGDDSRVQIMHPEKPKGAIEKFLSKLPADKPKDALNGIVEVINSKDLSDDQRDVLKGAMQDIVENASPDALVDIYKHSLMNPKFNTEAIKSNMDLDPKYIIRAHLSEPTQRGTLSSPPKYKYDHIAKFVDMVDSLDHKSKEPLKIWQKKFRRILSKRAE